MPDTLYMQERRRAILTEIHKQGRVSVAELSMFLSVSKVTIRQDLQALEDDGQLERTHGGAVLPSTIPHTPELSFEIRLETHNTTKDRLAACATQYVKEGDSIALDASTTVFAMLPYLKQIKRLTIVTNSLIVARQCLDSPWIDVILPGGKLRRDSISLVGQPDNLPEINLNAGFFGAHGITPEKGITESSLEETQMKQAMMSHCLTNTFLIDGSKWGKVAAYTLSKSSMTRIITSISAPSTMRQFFEDKGTEIITVTED